MSTTNDINITPGTGTVTFNAGSTSSLGLTDDQVNSIIANIVLTNTGDGIALYSGKTSSNIFNFRTLIAGSGILITEDDEQIKIISTGVIEEGSALATVATTGSYNDLIDKPSVATSLSNLSDVTVNAPTSGQIIVYNNGKWINEDLSISGVLTSINSVGTGIDLWDSVNSTSDIRLRTIEGGSGVVATVINDTIVLSIDDSNVNTWRSGAGLPAPTLGNAGDFYLDTDNGNVYVRSVTGWQFSLSIMGMQGEQGPVGSIGQRGSTWTVGTVNPSTQGNVGDMYLNSTTGYVYQFSSTGWHVICNIMGPQGIQGIQGLPGQNGNDGTRGSTWTSGANPPTSTTNMIGDMYLNTTNGYVYQYTATGWVNIAYTVGPQGETGQNGTDGARGSIWSSGAINPTSTSNVGDMYINTNTGEVFRYAATGWVDTSLNLVGPIGPQGEPGQTGEQGIQGPKGDSLTNKGTWVSGTTYDPNDYVFAPASANSSYTSMYVYAGDDTFSSITAPGSDPTNWMEIAAAPGVRGSNWYTGNDVPTSTDHIVGDMYLDLLNGEVYQYASTGWADTGYNTTGPRGPVGATGTRGSLWSFGSTNPSTTTANYGDMYLSTTTGDVFQYNSSGWTSTGYSTKGIQGEMGTAWTSGDVAPTSVANTGDFYLNTTTGDIYQYNGTWSQIGNIAGPQGQQGMPGQKGDKGDPGTGLTNKGAWVTGTTYSPGDYVFDVTSATDSTNSMWIYQGVTAAVSTKNPYEDLTNWVAFTAPSGQRGSIWTVGNGVPASTDANANDLYMDNTTGNVYQYLNSVWTKVATITGPQGLTGSVGQRGSEWSSSVGAPTSTTGNIMYDQYMDTSTGDIYQYNGAAWNKTGNIAGTNGKNGASWFNGAGNPPSSLNTMVIGDYYLNTSSGDVFEYVDTSGTDSWSLVGNMKGPSGTLDADFATYDPSTKILTFTCSAIVMGGALPTVDPVNAGQLWNNNGVVCISFGS